MSPSRPCLATSAGSARREYRPPRGGSNPVPGCWPGQVQRHADYCQVAKEGTGTEYNRKGQGAHHWLQHPRGGQGESQVGTEGTSLVDQGWLPMQPSSLVEQLLHPEFRWVYMDPRYLPLGSEGGREGHPLDRLHAPSSQDAGPMVGNCYGVQYTQGSVLLIHSFIRASRSQHCLSPSSAGSTFAGCSWGLTQFEARQWLCGTVLGYRAAVHCMSSL